MTKKSQIPYIFAAALMELIGLGIIIPLNPYMARDFGADALQIGLLMSVYSVIQLIVSPFWGKMSDQWGRRPILLLSLFFTAVSYVWFALAPHLIHLFLSRALAGAFGVTVSTSFACISDQTSSQSRSKSIALIGAAFGLGFIIGPALGGVLGSFQYGLRTSALGAGAFALTGFLLAFFKIKESRTQHPPKTSPKKSLLFPYEFIKTTKSFELKTILIIFFILSLSLTLVEAPLFLLMKDVFHWPQSLSSLGFAYIGLILALTQGFFVRYWIPYLGESKINQAGFALLALGLLGVCFQELRAVGAGVTLLSLGFGLSYTCLTGGVSLLTKKSHQGGVLGVHQSLSSLARILGPALGGWMYRDLGFQAPFLTAGGLAVLGFGLSCIFKKAIPNKGKTSMHQKLNAAQKMTSKEHLEDLEYIKINAFQLNNLIQNKILFSFFYLKDSKNPALESKAEGLAVLSQAEKVDPDSVLNMNFSSARPVVLICRNGAVSQKQTLKLLKKWNNIFYVEDGWQGLQENKKQME